MLLQILGMPFRTFTYLGDTNHCITTVESFQYPTIIGVWLVISAYAMAFDGVLLLSRPFHDSPDPFNSNAFLAGSEALIFTTLRGRFNQPCRSKRRSNAKNTLGLQQDGYGDQGHQITAMSNQIAALQEKINCIATSNAQSEPDVSTSGNSWC